MNFATGPVRGIEPASAARAPARATPPSAVTDLRQHWQFYLMALPAVVSILVFGYGPLFGLPIAFQDFSPLRGITAPVGACN